MEPIGFQPLVYRPPLPFRWWEKALRRVGFRIARRYGPAIPFRYDPNAPNRMFLVR